MGLNKSQGQMYSFITHTWNTIKGECFHDCSYCYMKKFGKLKQIHFDESELKTDLSGQNKFIFVGSSNDIFADDVEVSWLIKTLNHCQKYYNRYLFQSKNPKNFYYLEDLLFKNCVLCTTIESNRFYPKIMRNSPRPDQRAGAMFLLKKFYRYVTIEPVLDFDLKDMVDMIKMCHPKQVNIGADSGNNKLPEPSKEKILSLIEELSKFTTIHKKNNLGRLLK